MQVLKNNKNLKGYGLEFFKGCLPQILLRPFLNTLSHMWLDNPLSHKVQYMCGEFSKYPNTQTCDER